MSSARHILFSERNGLVKPSEALIVGDVPHDVANAISSALTRLMRMMDNSLIGSYKSEADELGEYIWSHIMCRSLISYDAPLSGGRVAIASWMQSTDTEWFRKLDLIEFVISRVDLTLYKNQFIKELNERFESLGFGYRILGGHVVEIVAESELKSIEDAINQSRNAISIHIAKALELHSKRPKGDYVNSIKESISAVEAMVRLETSKVDFSDAVKELKKNGIYLQPRMEDAMIKLYAYTNQPDTGIRHPLMETDSNYVPSSAESLYMLVTCSALVNYLKAKKSAAKQL